MDILEEHQELFVLLQEVISDIKTMSFYRLHRAQTGPRCSTQDVMRPPYSLKIKIPKQLDHMHDLVSFTDATCGNNLRMSKNVFRRLCYILEHVGGLVNTKNGYTISKQFNGVLFALLKLHTLFLEKPTPIEDDTTNERWKWFKVCLGALDGTYISLRVAQKDKNPYINRKGGVSVNILAVCDINMNYVYILSGWEGSAADSRVLKDAITRDNEFRVPDAILRSNSFYPVKVQIRIIMACVLLHNYIQIEMPVDPLEAEFLEVDDDISDDPNIGFVDQVEPSQQWTNWRESLVTSMFDEWRGNSIAAPPGRMRGGASNVSTSKSSRRRWTPKEEKVLANSLKELLSRSGFGWNESTNMITVDSEEDWNNFVKTDSNARNMRYKTWPLYKDWVEIFGKEVATGEGTEGFPDVEEEILNNGNGNPNGKDNEDGGY
ncbi:hypothetical protein BUALT_Bualt19G0031100 [Buddleja alternifolia]|uniref:DDE Tnp4 domain-containing protein n=1 Tax=Buddleja alternifolia TaxID=168488 RepID=A0AAV6VZP9_9LAMI|nr:hypothetical protein BUALT_Bualt19G0031100 [Buddleja alternifolia]